MDPDNSFEGQMRRVELEASLDHRRHLARQLERLPEDHPRVTVLLGAYQREIEFCRRLNA